VLSQIKTAANAPDNPPHPVVYVASVFGRALALAADARPEEVRFGVTQVLAVFDEEFSLDWVDIERAGIFERIYAGHSRLSAERRPIFRSSTSGSRS